MPTNDLWSEHITPLPDRLETAPTGMTTMNWGQLGQGNWAMTGGNRCFAGCPTITIQLNIAVLNQIFIVNSFAFGHH